MDAILCDELMQEIFQRLPQPSSAAAATVSRRWLRLFRSAKTSLSLRLSPHNHTPSSLSSFLSHFPFLSSLSLSAGGDASSFSDDLLLSAASSCPNLRHLRVSAGPVSLFPLLCLSSSCPHLTSLSVSLSRPLSFNWLLFFHSLKEFSVDFTTVSCEFGSGESNSSKSNIDAELQIESLGLCGIRQGDYGLDWLWRSCKKLKKLQLRSCDGIGDDTSISSFTNCLKNLHEVELRTCRTIVDEVLLILAENCSSLSTLLVYDGGSRDGLLQFITRSRSNLRILDLRLPLDLENDHLLSIAENFRGLSSLRLQSCCLVTGEGLKTIGVATRDFLEELALVNCDVVEREPGLLTHLGQNLRKLRKLDLSYNEFLVDKELIAMLASCTRLSELKLRGCQGLRNSAIVAICKSCKHLESVDLMDCGGIEAEAVEFFILNCRGLKQVQVEESKVSEIARSWASRKFIEVV
ncbi:hypothetical protein NMG60_11026632 [Bertholletia excelsa]